MLDMKRLYKILDETTVQLRKGDEVVEHQKGNLKVTEIYTMPHEDEVKDLQKVDCIFITVGVNKQKAEQYQDELVSILNDYPQPDRLAGGPSYIEVGGVIGDQGAAIQLFALGEVLGLWKVITGKTFGMSDAEARKLAGMGMLMISGYKGAKDGEKI